MAFLGDIGINSGPYRVGAIQTLPALNRVRLEGDDLICRIEKSESEGDPAVPCMKVWNPFRRRFLWSVDAGTRTIEIRCKFSPDSGSGKRPKLVVRENADIGVSSEQSAEAGAGADTWGTIGPITVNPTLAGALDCELRYDHNFDSAQISYWDTIVVT